MSLTPIKPKQGDIIKEIKCTFHDYMHFNSHSFCLGKVLILTLLLQDSYIILMLGKTCREIS